MCHKHFKNGAAAVAAFLHNIVDYHVVETSYFHLHSVDQERYVYKS